ncbi:hypothetical protein [Pseudostreptobacillus hongkongensis]|uniref:hypothetical protein n=1 Tax=Pseudostreptobacillus hongkongensis TaxID=1162717 RepID=UPI000832A3E9|nr:hypothetical protein [Pseudostreptobacillus hongkongensis]
MKKVISFIIILSILILSNFYILNYRSNNNANKNTEIKINKNIFKNRLLDDVIDEFNLKFNSSKFVISNFSSNEIESNIYFYSQIKGYEEAYLLIEYKDFDVTRISFHFTNARSEYFNDISNIMTLLVKISDLDIKTKEAQQIIINMFSKFQKGRDNVTLIYDNNLVYSINITDNNNIEFNIK